MKKRYALIPLLVLLASSLSCILETAGGATLSPDQISTLSAQTLAIMQWQTQSAGGNTPAVVPGNTPAESPTVWVPPTVTATMMPPPATDMPTVTQTPVPCNWVQFISDVNYPDGSEVGLHDHFTKTWRLKNIGSCTWTSGYKLIFDHGDPMGAPAEQQLTGGTVAPGATVDVSVDLLSPDTAGTYQGYFKLRSADGHVFGIGAGADGAFWVKVVAVGAGFSVQQVEGMISISMGVTGTVSVSCPAGSVIVGGGFDGGPNISPHRSERSGNGWVVQGHRYLGANGTLKAYAYCLSGAAASSTSGYTEKTVNPGLSSDATYTCSGGSVMSGGGYGFPEGKFWVYVLRMEGNGLKMFAKNISGSSATFRSHPVCLTSAGAVTVQAENTGSVPGSTTGTVEAGCPAGTTVTGGGMTLSVNMNLTGMYKKPGENKWVVKALNQNGSSMNAVSRAICLAYS